MDQIDVIAQLTSLFCYHGADQDGASEPYLWTIAMTIDGRTITHTPDSLTLTGAPWFFFGPGNHGNLGGTVSSGVTLTIPPNVGRVETTLQPIVISFGGQQFSVPGLLVFVAVLLEENDTPDDAVQAGHEAMNNLFQTQFSQAIADINLADAGAAALQAVKAGQDPRAAVTALFTTKMQEVATGIANYAGDVVTAEIVKHLKGLGAIPGLVDPDQMMGTVNYHWVQTDLEPLRNSNRLDLTQTIDDAASGAPLESATYIYNLHGQIWRPVEITYTPALSDLPPGRYQVTGVDHELSSGHKEFINGVGGSLADGTPWFLKSDAVMDLIKAGTHTFWVQGANGVTADVVINPNPDHAYFPFLATAADNDKSDNLTALPPAIQEISHIQNVPG